MTIDAATTREVHKRRQTQPALILVELTHSSFAAPPRVVGNNEDIVSNGRTFAAEEAVAIPPRHGVQAGRGRLTLGDIGTELREKVKAADDDERIKARLEVVLAGSPDTIRKAWSDLDWIDLQVLDARIEGTLAQQSYGQEIFPPRVQTEDAVPGARWP